MTCSLTSRKNFTIFQNVCSIFARKNNIVQQFVNESSNNLQNFANCHDFQRIFPSNGAYLSLNRYVALIIMQRKCLRRPKGEEYLCIRRNVVLSVIEGEAAHFATQLPWRHTLRALPSLIPFLQHFNCLLFSVPVFPFSYPYFQIRSPSIISVNLTILYY